MTSSRPSLPFISALASSRQAEILEVVARNGWDYFRNQLSLNPQPGQPALPLPTVLRQILIELGPTFVKLGQLLSTRPDLLSPGYIQALETLQSDVPALPWSQIQAILQTDLAQPITEVFADLNPRPVAAGSLGQVHQGRLHSGEVVALKVQRPGIRQVIERDLEVLEAIAAWFSNDSIGRAYDLPGLVDEFRTSILNELDFRREARNTDLLREVLNRSSLWQPGQVVVPQVYSAFTSERILVLEWIDGIKLTEARLSEPRQRTVAALVTQVVMEQMFLNRFFHADPHPGNFLYIGDEHTDRIALLDCGMVATLDPRTQRILIDLIVGIVDEQPRQVAQSVRELGFTRLDVDIRALESAFDRLLRRFYTRPLEEINLAQLLNEALRIPRENQIQMPGSIGLVVKAIANVEGIARRLDPQFAFVEVARPVVVRSLQQRLISPQVLPEVARSSLYFSQLLLDFPQRLEVLLDRFERSELGLNWRWRGQTEFQRILGQVLQQISLALIGVGCLLSGSLLLAVLVFNPTAPVMVSWWGQGLLVAGVSVNVWVVVRGWVKR